MGVCEGNDDVSFSELISERSIHQLCCARACMDAMHFARM